MGWFICIGNRWGIRQSRYEWLLCSAKITRAIRIRVISVFQGRVLGWRISIRMCGGWGIVHDYRVTAFLTRITTHGSWLMQWRWFRARMGRLHGDSDSLGDGFVKLNWNDIGASQLIRLSTR